MNLQLFGVLTVDIIFNWLTEPFASSLMQNALKEMAMVSLLAGLVGTFVVLRGIAFIVDGLSHAILPGIAMALLAGGSLFLGAVGAALLVTLLIALTARHNLVSEDSAIGIFFTGAFAVGVILISKAEIAGGSLNEILFGQLFAVKDEDLLLMLVIGLVILALVAGLFKELIFSSFDPQMAAAAGYRTLWLDLALYLAVALTVVVSLPAVGNILALAFLITPAATARLFTDRITAMIGLAVGLALLSSLAGLYLSYYQGIPGGGAAVVLAGTLMFLVGLLVSPRYGGLGWLLTRRALRRQTFFS